jgi:ribokinase
MKPKIVVVGSSNTDMVLNVTNFPAAGETVLGSRFMTVQGGKGANQAVAAARLGADCRFVARIGDDTFGQTLLAGMKAVGINCDHVGVTEGVATGVALIVVDERGENAITVASGANAKLSIEDIEAAKPLIATAKVCLLQLEIPLETASYAIRMAKSLGVEVILDCAPAPDPATAPQTLFEADILTPNETEAQILTGEQAAGKGESRLLAAALVERGARNIVLKLGEKGSLLFDGNHFEHVPPFKIMPVDTTAAGDAFSAALAVSRAKGIPLPEAVLYANAAGAAACLKFGAQPAMPTADEVRSLMMESGKEPTA